MRTYSSWLKFTSYTTIAFFSWTFLSLWQIPAAYAAERQKTTAREQTARHDGGKQKPEGRFEGVLDELREKAEKAGEKHAKGQDDSAERKAIRAKDGTRGTLVPTVHNSVGGLIIGYRK